MLDLESNPDFIFYKACRDERIHYVGSLFSTIVPHINISTLNVPSERYCMPLVFNGCLRGSLVDAD